MKDILDSEEVLITKINTIIVKLSGLLLAAQLKKFTHLWPRIRNRTRWSSTFHMLQQYVRMRDVLPKLKSDDIAAISLTPSENRRIDGLIQQLKPLESVTLELQRDCTTVSDARTLFDAVMHEFPDTTNRLSPSAGIVHSPVFENAVVKLQQNNSSALSSEESECVSDFEIIAATELEAYCGTDNDGLSFAHRALKRQRIMNGSNVKKYSDTRFLLSSSNICERLFSKAGFALTDRRKGLNPVHLEAQVFLHLNRDLWNVTDLNKLTL